MRDERGFSLVEVLAALLILTVVITVSMAAFVERNKRLQQASEIVLAYQALANQAEYVRRKPYASLETGVGFDDPNAAELLAPLGHAVPSIVVTETKPGIKNVLLRVRWRQGQREAKLTLVRTQTGGGNLW